MNKIEQKVLTLKQRIELVLHHLGPTWQICLIAIFSVMAGLIGILSFAVLLFIFNDIGRDLEKKQEADHAAGQGSV
ncbi:MAG: hypothetical protein KGI54_14750 [Pseudomonadota bacterium]|nr:hypothetical protein [Pseudomonadota bacterium]